MLMETVDTTISRPGLGAADPESVQEGISGAAIAMKLFGNGSSPVARLTRTVSDALLQIPVARGRPRPHRPGGLHCATCCSGPCASP
jgi:hypothetical protein